jgi:hypothetical protein
VKHFIAQSRKNAKEPGAACPEIAQIAGAGGKNALDAQDGCCEKIFNDITQGKFATTNKHHVSSKENLHNGLFQKLG